MSLAGECKGYIRLEINTPTQNELCTARINIVYGLGTLATRNAGRLCKTAPVEASPREGCTINRRF